MPNTPSTQPPAHPETPKGSKFRLAIAFILALGAGIGIGKCVYDKKDTDHPGKPKLTDIMKPDAEAERQELSLKQCQMNLLLGVAGKQCEEFSEDVKYLERGRANLEKRAAEIIERLGITNEEDKEEILQKVLKGCTEFGNVDGTTLQLKEPPSPDTCGDPIKLTEGIKANWFEISPEDYEALNDEEKKWIDMFRDKKEEELLREIHFNDIKKRLDMIRAITTQGDFEINNPTNKEMVNAFVSVLFGQITEPMSNFIQAMEEARDNMLKTQDQDERRGIICAMTEKMEKIKKNAGGLDLLDMDDVRINILIRTLYSLAGITDHDPLENPYDCNLIP